MARLVKPECNAAHALCAPGTFIEFVKTFALVCRNCAQGSRSSADGEELSNVTTHYSCDQIHRRYEEHCTSIFKMALTQVTSRTAQYSASSASLWFILLFSIEFAGSNCIFWRFGMKRSPPFRRTGFCFGGFLFLATIVFSRGWSRSLRGCFGDGEACLEGKECDIFRRNLTAPKVRSHPAESSQPQPMNSFGENN